MDIKDVSLQDEGRRKIDWASKEMRVLSLVRGRFREEKPLKGVKVGACLHVTSETANLVLTLKEGGAEVFLCASNPLSTQDEVASALVSYGIEVFAIRGEDEETYYRHINMVLDREPDITIDDGADLVATVHSKRTELSRKILGGTEETTTGVVRLRSLEREGRLLYPIIAVNEAKTKYLFDNRYGTGQSTVDGITRATNILWAGKRVVICGYGWCGRGVAMRARGLGARVIICEVDPIKAIEALMDGFEVMKLEEASKIGDIFITTTGNINVIDKKHLELMKDGAILSNSGHFDVEINLKALRDMAREVRRIRPLVDEYVLPDGRRLYLLGEGRLVNLSCAEGHPPSVMDMSFSNQALCVEYIVKKGGLPKKVLPVPEEIDREVGRLKLKAMGIDIDELTDEQKEYLRSWHLGT